MGYIARQLFSLTSRCLILMLPILCFHCIANLRRKRRESISDTFLEIKYFTPLVSSTFGVMSILFITFFQETCLIAADKRDVSYDVVMFWQCCRISLISLCCVQPLIAYDRRENLRIMILLAFKPLIWLYQRDRCVPESLMNPIHLNTV